MRINDKIVLTDEEIGDDHISTSDFTPIRDDAFDKSDDEKISIIQEHVKEIMLTLGLDLTDDSLRGTPKRIAKSYVKELFYGLNPKNKPKASGFELNLGYKFSLGSFRMQTINIGEGYGDFCFFLNLASLFDGR